MTLSVINQPNAQTHGLTHKPGVGLPLEVRGHAGAALLGLASLVADARLLGGRFLTLLALLVFALKKLYTMFYFLSLRTLNVEVIFVRHTNYLLESQSLVFPRRQDVLVSVHDDVAQCTYQQLPKLKQSTNDV